LARRLLLVALLALVAVPVAQADGDPASDYLITQRVFLPYDTKIPQSDQQVLQGIVADAHKKGYPIRVALIGSDYDLGSVTILWKQPKRYAQFLAQELQFVHKDPVLTVMPNGMGFYWVGHKPAGESATLADIPVVPGGKGLAQAATRAVQQLAAARGLHLTPLKVAAPKASHRNRDDRLIIVAALAVALIVGSVARLLMLRRRRSA
jgi:hypothetical protein